MNTKCALAIWALCIVTWNAVEAGESPPAAAANSATTPGLSAAELAKLPHVLFAHDLEDVPNRNIVVSMLDFPPAPAKVATPPPCSVHRHAGPAYVYVLKGTMRLGIGGQPVQTLHAGQSFYEPAGALHTVAENASATEPAAAIAVLILPHGAPILTFEKCAKT
jgi:mannose-6-phosphate isomerase-like protein (cupin superfamily)